MEGQSTNQDGIVMELTWEAFDNFGADIRGAETIDKDVAKTLTSTAPTAITWRGGCGCVLML